MSPLLYQSICLHHRPPPCCLRILPAGKLRVYHIVPLCARAACSEHRGTRNARLQQHAICISCVICSLLNLCSEFSLMRMYPVLVFSVVSFCAPGFAHKAHAAWTMVLRRVWLLSVVASA